MEKIQGFIIWIYKTFLTFPIRRWFRFTNDGRYLSADGTSVLGTLRIPGVMFYDTPLQVLWVLFWLTLPVWWLLASFIVGDVTIASSVGWWGEFYDEYIIHDGFARFLNMVIIFVWLMFIVAAWVIGSIVFGVLSAAVFNQLRVIISVICLPITVIMFQRVPQCAGMNMQILVLQTIFVQMIFLSATVAILYHNLLWLFDPFIKIWGFIH